MLSMQLKSGQRMCVHAGCSNGVLRLRTGSSPAGGWRMHGAALAARQQRRQPALSCRCRAVSSDDDGLEQPGHSQQLDTAQRHRLESLELLSEEAAPRLREAQPADAAQQQPASPQPAQLPGLIRRLQAPLGAGLLAGLLGTGFDIAGPGSVAQAIGVLAAIVAFHELGHFTAARAQGIHVSKFSVGFGPSLFSWKGKEVEYSLRAIPLGGYVGFPDDDPDSPYEKDDPDLLRNRPVGQRALVISAGIIANVILAYSVLLAQITTVGTPTLDFLPGVLAPQVVKSGAAYKAGVQPGDIILGINGEALTPSPNAVRRVVDVIKDNPGRQVTLTIQRGLDSKPFPLPVTPDLAPRDNGGVIGVKLGANAKVVRTFAKNPIEALQLAGSEFGRLANQITTGLQQIVFNFGAVQDKISGPVAIVNVGAEVARTDLSGLYQFAALVNLNLAVVNALPLPALDGGYLALLALEAVRQKKLDQVVEQTIMATGLLVLMGAGLWLVVRDITHLSG